MKKLWLLPILFICGCRYVQYTTQDNRVVRYLNVGFDTKIGTLKIQAPDGTILTLENLDASSQGLQVASKALDLANKVP